MIHVFFLHLRGSFLAISIMITKSCPRWFWSRELLGGDVTVNGGFETLLLLKLLILGALHDARVVLFCKLMACYENKTCRKGKRGKKSSGYLKLTYCHLQCQFAESENWRHESVMKKELTKCKQGKIVLENFPVGERYTLDSNKTHCTVWIRVGIARSGLNPWFDILTFDFWKHVSIQEPISIWPSVPQASPASPQEPLFNISPLMVQLLSM